ncbi:MAG: phosphatidate cytidylyltransferase [Gammaproteobacteria bacterium]|nr:phosphatidate cytidylyltransferase [Gammaproteobacteria bacterium]
MLKQRILTAIVLVPLLVAALFYLSIPWITLLFGVFIAAAAWEWAELSGLRRLSARIAYVICLLLFGALGMNVIPLQDDPIVSLLVAAVLWWLWASVELISRPDVAKGMFTSLAGRVVGGFLVLVPLWIASVYLLATDNDKPRMLLFLFVLVWVADTAAYFAGSVMGRTKLAPHISPGKTVEGVAGGVLGVVLLAWLCGTIIWRFEGTLLALWTGLAALTALFSVVGDLTESKLKRIAGVKDSGKLLPGHGGVLDRIDAMTAAAPVFALGAILLLKY